MKRIDSLAEANVSALRRNKISPSKMDVQTLSDVELKEQLIKHGTIPGPILPTTRTVYEKKLKQLLNEGPPVPQTRQNGNGDMDRYSDSEEEGPCETRIQRRRDVIVADVSNNTSTFNQAPFSSQSEASKANLEFESSFSVTRMVEQMDQRPAMCQTAGHLKIPGSTSLNNYSVKEALKVDKNTMTYRIPTITSKTRALVHHSRFQADDLLQKDELADQFVSSTPSPLGMSATKRKPIKGAAGRPIQFKYDDIVTQARLVEQARAELEKGSVRKQIPVYIQVLVFAIVAFFALVFLTMENNPENPFLPFVEKVELQQPE